MIVGSKKRRVTKQQGNAGDEEIADAKPGDQTNEEIILQSIEQRDYSAAATFIDFIIQDLGVPETEDLLLWKGYSLFHMGDYNGAIDLYTKMLEKNPENTVINLYISSCHFYNKEYDEALSFAEKGPSCDYRTRLIFHIAHQRNDTDSLYEAHSQLIGTLDNQMSLGAIHYLRANYQEAIQLYQKLLAENPDYIALNVYVAMCQFKLEQYQESNESVDQYLAANSDSAVALNLKSCDYFKIFAPDVAESQLLQIKKFGSASFTFVDSLIKHNLCVFANGEDGLKVFPPLVGIIPEAILNLAIIYLRSSDAKDAYDLLADFNPIDVNEYILKGTALIEYGQIAADGGIIEEASQIFESVSQMDDIKDTVIGRCALTTTTFVRGEYEKTIKIMESFEHVMGVTDEFQFNKGMAYAAIGKWPEAEVCFEAVQNPAYKYEASYQTWLARCYIKTSKPDKAWGLYLDATTTENASALLQIIAADCYEGKYYLYAMRAYDVLSKIDKDPDLIDGMIAASIGAFRNILTNVDPPDGIQEILGILNSDPKGEPHAATIQNYVNMHPDQFQLLDY